MSSFSDYLKAIRFGLEYETLIQYKPKTRIDVIDKPFGCKSVEGFKKPQGKEANSGIEAQHMKIRATLAKLYNEYNKFPKDYPIDMSIKHRFVVEDGYHGNKCCVNPEDTYLLDNNVWIITYDQSVEAQPPIINNIDHTEFVSPPLNFLNDFEVVPNVISEILPYKIENENTFELKSNSTTSNHVHMTCGNRFKEPKHLVKICVAWLYFEDVFMFMCEQSRRNNKFAMSMKSLFMKDPPDEEDYEIFMNASDEKLEEYCWDLEGIVWAFQGEPHNHKTRYKAFNLQNLFTIGTIECRLKEWCKSEEIMMWITLLAVFYSRVLSNDCLSVILTPYPELKECLWHGSASKTSFGNCIDLFFKFINFEPLEEYWRQRISDMNDVSFFQRNARVNIQNIVFKNDEDEDIKIKNDILGKIKEYCPKINLSKKGGKTKSKSKHFLQNRNMKELREKCAQMKLNHKGLNKTELVSLIQSKRKSKAN